MEGRTNFSRRLKQFNGLTWLTLTPIFHDRFTLWDVCVASTEDIGRGGSSRTVRHERLHNFPVTFEGLRERTNQIITTNKPTPTTMKLRKLLVKPVTWQKTCNYRSCSVLPPEIVMHVTYNVILWLSTDRAWRSWWKNRTAWYNCRFSATSLALRVIFVHRKCPQIYASCMTFSGGRPNNTL